MLNDVFGYIIGFIVEKDEDDSYYAHCPGLQGIHVSGDTPEEALKLAQKAVENILEIRLSRGEALPESEHLIALRQPTSISLNKFKHDSVLFFVPPHLAKKFTNTESIM